MSFVTSDVVPLRVWCIRPGTWLTIASWKVRFPGLDEFDLRIHKSLSLNDAWVIAEASTGMQIISSLDGIDGVCAAFLSRKLTADMMRKGIAAGTVRIAELPAD